MKRIQLTERELTRLIQRVINEEKIFSGWDCGHCDAACAEWDDFDTCYDNCCGNAGMSLGKTQLYDYEDGGTELVGCPSCGSPDQCGCYPNCSPCIHPDTILDDPE